MRHRLRTTLAAALLFACFSCNDSNEPRRSDRTLTCDENAPAAFLKSKDDDDDGDGNPLDEDFPTINDEDDDIADHAWIRDDAGGYHLFFHNEGLTSGSAIEHYLTRDFRRLDYVGIALEANPGGWDSYGLWAPHVVRSSDTFYMFYTGIDGVGPDARQRIGLATSTDLVTWTRYPVNDCPGTAGDGCVYECGEPWTTWGDEPGSFNQQCRDPFVLWDPGRKRWVLFATAKSTNQFGVVTVAYSDSLIAWKGAGFIDGTRRLVSGAGAQTTGGQAENPHVMSHAGVHYLLFNDWQDPEDTLTVAAPRTQTQYLTSSELTADTLGSLNWTYRGYIPDPGVNAIEVQRLDDNKWLMTQSISNVYSGDHDGHRRELRVKCVIWMGNFGFETYNLGF